MGVNTNNIIGVVGGMGPQAGIALLNSILHHTKATTDQQHLPVILMSFPGKIADRTLFLEGKERVNPALAIATVIGKLEHAGANIIGMACNTSHSPGIYDVILEELDKANSRVKMISMPAETCHYVRDNFPFVKRIGLMTTNGTYNAGIYKNLLLQLGYEVIVPDAGFQNEVIHKMIYDPSFGIKANTRGVHPAIGVLAKKAMSFFKKNRAEAIILGCTEFSLVFSNAVEQEISMIDSNETLARALIREALTPERLQVLS
jgi:aspartate racemase